MEIQTKRLLLCPLGMKYLNSTFEYARDIENTKFMKYLPSDAIEETVEFLTGVEKEWQKGNPEDYEFAILADDIHIGAICLCLNKDRTEGELGWIINKKYWHKGYATEAAKACKEYACETLNAEEVVSIIRDTNIPSQKVAERNGMKIVDNWGKHYRGEDMPHYLYSVKREEL